MSLFGEHLRAVVEANKVNIYNLAKTAGIDRTIIHKIISSGRIPSDEYVRKLAEALPLSPEERQRFLESYNISKIGELRYRQRIQVKKLIESIAHIENGNVPQISVTIHQSSGSEANTTAIGHFAVNNLVKSLIIEETIASEAKQKIDFVIPVSYQYFYNELLACYLSHPGLRIRHIIAFSKKANFTDNHNGNVGLLSNVLPFAFAPGAGYYPYYFYSSSLDIELTHIMPYFMLTSSGKLVLISKDFDKAALVCDSDIVALYRERFSDALEQARPLMKRLSSITEVLGHCIDSDIDDIDTPSHWIEPEPCIGPLVTDKEIDIRIKQDIPQRDELLQLICAHYGFLRKNQLSNINVCTTDGLYRMLDSGFIYNAPTEIMNPFIRDDIKALLVRLRDRIHNDKVKVLFTNPSKIKVPSKTLLQINRKTGINFIMFDRAASDFRAVCLSEDSIDEAFADFIENIEGSELVYNEKDSLAVLNSVINEL